MATFALFERRILVRRTKEGLAAAKQRGKRLGRPLKLSRRQLSYARRALDSGAMTKADLAKKFSVAPWTFTRGLQRKIPQKDVTF